VTRTVESVVVRLSDGISIWNADCRDIMDPDMRVDAVVTDPPYGIGFAAQPTKWQRRAGMTPKDWDNGSAKVDWLLSLSDLVVIWGGNYFPLPPSRGWLSWFKPDAPPSMGSFELAWTSLDQNPRQISQSIAATNAERLGHPTQKPLRVIEWTLEQAGIPKGATVFDPFMGVGTTGAACIRTGRKFIGIERDHEYFAKARKRLERELSQIQGTFDFGGGAVAPTHNASLQRQEPRQ
jgi:site-specific DNA-methyltransferase (adenine-specific)